MTLLLLVLGIALADTTTIGGARFVRHELVMGTGEVNLAAGDLDGDGIHDVAATSSDQGSVTIFMGRPSGQLERGRTFECGPAPTDVAMADVDRDGALDLVVANHETSHLGVLWGDGEGGFAPWVRIPVDVDPHPHAVAILDADLDGSLDVAVDDRNRGGLLILHGDDGRAFGTWTSRVNTGGDPYLGFASADLNADGRPDFVTPNPRQVAVTLSSGGGWAEPRRLGDSPPFGVALADMNGDGSMDIVSASGESGRDVTVWAGPDFEVRMGSFTIARGPKLVEVGDLNADGLDDAVVGSWNSGLSVIFGGREGLESEALQISGHPWGLLVADLNGDGRDDLVVADGVGPEAAIYVSTP